MMKKTRNTYQRKLVMDAVLNRTDHPSADDIYCDAKNQDAHISRGTIYRNLHLLSEMGVIGHLYVLTGADRFDYRTDQHYHFLCTMCGKLFDVNLPYLAELDNRSLPEGFSVQGHRLIFEGVCAKCNAKQSSKV
ncbi:MAG: transcriptional repressor [Clostridia bacterium]